jgi:hypothetical protein
MLNIKEYKLSKILFIKGVFLNNCTPIDDLFEQQLMDQITADKPIIKYDKLPSTFTSIDKWTKTVNIQCWNCNLMFDTIPVFIPLSVEVVSCDNYNIGVEGCFCSFTCASYFIDIKYKKIYDNINKKNMLKLLWKIFHKSTNMIKFFSNAPCKYNMIHYGGDRSIKDFKSEIQKIENKLSDNCK